MHSVSIILGATVDSIQPLTAAGLDSLGAVELRNSLEGELVMKLPATLLYDYPTVQDIAGFLKVGLSP
jgi:acyl carrier protein